MTDIKIEDIDLQSISIEGDNAEIALEIFKTNIDDVNPYNYISKFIYMAKRWISREHIQFKRGLKFTGKIFANSKYTVFNRSEMEDNLFKLVAKADQFKNNIERKIDMPIKDIESIQKLISDISMAFYETDVGELLSQKEKRSLRLNG